MASTPNPPPRPQPAPPKPPSPPPPQAKNLDQESEGKPGRRPESDPKNLDRKAKDAPKYPILPPEQAASLFKNGHRIAKDGDPPSKWVSMGRLGDGTAVMQTPMTPEIEKQIAEGSYYLAEGVKEDDPTAPPVEAGPAGPPVLVDAPLVTGSGVISEPLSCTMGNWNNMESSGWGENGGYRYQWKKMQSGNPSVIPDATTATYAPTSQDANKDVFCMVMATNSLGQATSDSNTITVQPPAAEVRSGNAKPTAR